jgi:hypothetical protein
MSAGIANNAVLDGRRLATCVRKSRVTPVTTTFAVRRRLGAGGMATIVVKSSSVANARESPCGNSRQNSFAVSIGSRPTAPAYARTHARAKGPGPGGQVVPSARHVGPDASLSGHLARETPAAADSDAVSRTSWLPRDAPRVRNRARPRPGFRRCELPQRAVELRGRAPAATMRSVETRASLTIPAGGAVRRARGAW